MAKGRVDPFKINLEPELEGVSFENSDSRFAQIGKMDRGGKQISLTREAWRDSAESQPVQARQGKKFVLIAVVVLLLLGALGFFIYYLQVLSKVEINPKQLLQTIVESPSSFETKISSPTVKIPFTASQLFKGKNI